MLFGRLHEIPKLHLLGIFTFDLTVSFSERKHLNSVYYTFQNTLHTQKKKSNVTSLLM